MDASTTVPDIKIIREKTGWDKRTRNGGMVPDTHCVLCGRKVNDARPSSFRWVMMNHVTGEIVAPEANADPMAFSWYQVGLACASTYLKGLTLTDSQFMMGAA